MTDPSSASGSVPDSGAAGAVPGDTSLRERRPGSALVRPGGSEAASGEAQSATGRLLAAARAVVVRDRIGSFDLLEQIGVGGMGAVYRAIDRSLERVVALKLLPLEHASDVESVQRFYQEARAAARLNHENIARVYSIGHEEPYHFIAFEFIDGTNIRQRVAERGPLPAEEALAFTLQIAQALIHATERKVVHRDIKPSNIIVTTQGRAKLVDMGLARRFEHEENPEDGLTQTGMMLGTFDYISPEQARDPRGVDVRSDLYSLGCTLYHMLTGQPPFPGGTVVQKLLQHQEEAPPDVRTLNPGVPAELALVVNKLMAKDREQRHQTPEELARDLMGLAGDLGLAGDASPRWSPESGNPLGWERHLVWAVPTGVLGVIVAALVWSGWQPDPLRGGPRGGRPAAAAASIGPSRSGLAPLVKTEQGLDTRPAMALETIPAKSLLREVSSGEDLDSVLHNAESGTVIVLIDDGPYNLMAADLQTGPGVARPDRNLTIKAAPGVRPLLRPQPSALDLPDSEPAALLHFAGGRILLEGLQFVVDPDQHDSELATLVADAVDLTIERCQFRLANPAAPGSGLTGVRLRGAGGATPVDAQRPGPVQIRESHFDGGQVAVQAQGPADILIQDCSFGPGAPSFVLEGGPTPAAFPPRLALRHVSIMAGTGPVFRLSGTPAILRLDDSVIATPGPSVLSTLLASDNPSTIDWLGRGNLYSRIETYLQPTGRESDFTAIRGFDSWAESPTAVRELDSAATTGAVWYQPEPDRLIARSNPTTAFQLDPNELPNPGTGMRRGPLGPNDVFAELSLSTGIAPLAFPPRPIREPSPTTAAPSTTADATGATTSPPATPLPAMSVRSDTAPAQPLTTPSVTTIEGHSEPTERAIASEIPNEDSESLAATALTDGGDARGARSLPIELTDGVVPARDATATVTESSLRAALSAPIAPLEPIQLPAGADLALAPTRLAGSMRWVIQGPDNVDGKRPILRLRSRGQSPDASDWESLVGLAETELELRNVDLVVESAVSSADPVAVFDLASQARLDLINCTITMAAPPPRSAVFRIQGPVPATGQGDGFTATAPMIRLRSSAIRAEGDLCHVESAARLDIEVNNALIATAGSLLDVAGWAALPDDTPISVLLERVTARCAGGLMHVEGGPARDQLPSVLLKVRESIVATTDRGDPVIRIDWQDQRDESRERVQWQGQGVAYHRIEIYRRDQVRQPGAVPILFDRDDWRMAVSDRDNQPFHGSVDFDKPWNDGQPISSFERDDALLAPGSPHSERGAGVETLPAFASGG